MTSELALHVLEAIRAAGVRTICICPGGRNADWVRLCSAPDIGFEVLWFPEERSASFFAIGRMQATRMPVAVCTTSGTAAGELLPAAMEAFYSGLPLILLTADRPRRYRGSGAPQAAEQVGIFGVYAPTAYDLEGAETLPGPIMAAGKPVHINVCFEDPNSDGALKQPPQSEARPNQASPGARGELRKGWSLRNELANMRRPLVIVGAVHRSDRMAASEFLRKWQAPVYLEALSGLRGFAELEPFSIRVADNLFSRAAKTGYEPDAVMRIGGVPTHRIWRDIEDLELPVVSLSRLEFSGLGRDSVHCQDFLSIGLRAAAMKLEPCEPADELLLEDRKLHAGLETLLDQHPNSEPGFFRTLSTATPAGTHVYLGNSLPVREWDLAAKWGRPGLEISASRGLNGIDGQVSTFLGMCQPGRPNWAILGDLTALYDLAGPWPLTQLPKDLDANLVIVNNGGGKIFERMFPEAAFQNRHTLSFEHWAAMWGLAYQRVNTAEALAKCAQRPNKGLRVIEAIPDRVATERFWAAHSGALA